MAKAKKKKATATQQPYSPKQFIREKARSFPIDKCYINPNWEEAGMATCMVTRRRGNGKLIYGCFLVDTFCLGVKDCLWQESVNPEDLKERFLDNKIFNLQEVDYNVVHNVIYGAIDFAAEAGINPVPDFAVAEYILKEDTDDIPLIEYTFGKDGNYLLIANEYNERDQKLIPVLAKRLGDKFDFIKPIGDYEVEEDDDYPGYSTFNEPFYTYVQPDYPATAEVTHPEVAEILLSEENVTGIPPEDIARLKAIPANELADDIAAVILYEIGRTWKEIDEESASQQATTPDYESESSVLNSLVMLGDTGLTPKAMDAVCQLLRQTDDFINAHIGDYIEDLLVRIWLKTPAELFDRLADLLVEPGLDPYVISHATGSLATTLEVNPGLRETVERLYRKALDHAIHSLEHGEPFSPELNAFMFDAADSLNMTSLLPQFKKLSDADAVNTDITFCDLDSLLTEKQLEITPDKFADNAADQFRKIFSNDYKR